MASARGALKLIKQIFSDFLEDQCPRMAAALSYYTVFSLPPLIILLLLIVGAFVDPGDVSGSIERQISSLVGPAGAEQVRAILENVKRPGSGGPLTSVFGVAALIFGATGVFLELQSALNAAWEVKPDPKRGGIKNFLLKRLFSFGMVLAIGFILLVSLAVSAALVAAGDVLSRFLPGSESLLQLVNLLLSFAVITALFTAMYRVLPDAIVAWRDAWVGALATTVLFVIGKSLIGFYLGTSDPGSAYGAAGSLAVMFLWIYYSAMILLLGAEITQSWAEHRGRGIVPEKGAVRVVEQEREIRGAAARSEPSKAR